MKTIKNLTAEQIRKSILQLAIQGKLVKQDPNDEPASELVKRIYEEKHRLIKEGKLKKDKNESFIYKGDDNCYYENVGSKVRNITDELPFEIPNNWTWIRIKNALNIQTGVSFKKEQATHKFKQNEIRVLRGGNILPFKLTLKNDDLYVPSNLTNDESLLRKNDLLTPSVTSLESIGKLCMVERDMNNVTAGGFVFILRPYLNQDSFAKICLLFISSPAFQTMMSKITKKSGQAFYNLSKERFSNLLFPIPPVNEMKRIVLKVFSFFPPLSDYQKVETNLRELENSFETKLKASILQYAIEGKLVKQNPNDQPASVLLEKIKSEKEKLIKTGKIKRDKQDSEIILGNDKSYYGNSVTLSLSDVCSYGVTITKTPSLRSGVTLPLIELDQIKSGDSTLPSGKVIKLSDKTQSQTYFEEGMILYSKLRPYLDKVVYADKNGVCSSELVPFWSYINNKWLLLYLHSPNFINRVNSDSFGVKMPRVKPQTFLTSKINVFSEQYMCKTTIKVEKIMSLFC